MLAKNVAVIGYSGHGIVLVEAALDNNLNVLGYAEKKESISNPFDLTYLGSEYESNFFQRIGLKSFLLGIGNNGARELLYKLVTQNNCEVLTLVSKSASVSRSAIIGNGTFINRNVSVNALARVGSNVILNTGCIIEHHCYLSNSVHIAPGAVLAGNVVVGERSFIGANSVIKQGITIGSDVVVGAGSVVLESINDGMKIVGNPGRVLL
jgi:sugar O-acyltransferase (sialic acid O-acetyltransferase NeuD family)